MAASRSNRRTGWRVTSTASSGVWHISLNVCLRRSLRYSSMYRPACLISQTGVQSGASILHALRNLSALAMFVVSGIV